MKHPDTEIFRKHYRTISRNPVIRLCMCFDKIFFSWLSQASLLFILSVFTLISMVAVLMLSSASINLTIVGYLLFFLSVAIFLVINTGRGYRSGRNDLLI